jgi:4-hydroxybutyryl-CoA dehydratase/vinylacetyl-CoA-Delta-isomerase
LCLSRVASPAPPASSSTAARSSVADEPAFAPGINAVGVAYDFAQEHAALMTARQATSGKIVNHHAAHQRDVHRPADQVEAVRLVCRESSAFPSRMT